MSRVSYEKIKDSAVLGFEEYIDEDGLNVAQASAKILEDEWRSLNDSLFSKTLYFISIAIESLKLNEIADFIYSKLDGYLDNIEFEEFIDKNDVEQLIQDIKLCRRLLEKEEYKILETNDSTKSRIEYILGLKND